MVVAGGNAKITAEGLTFEHDAFLIGVVRMAGDDSSGVDA